MNKKKDFPIRKLLICILFCLAYSNLTFADADKQKSNPLNHDQLDKIILYGAFTGDAFSGKIFNQNSDIVITQITIEAVPKEENNVFNKFSPRLFNVDIICRPRVMSQNFSFESGALNSEFHTAKVVEAKGYSEK